MALDVGREGVARGEGTVGLELLVGITAPLDLLHGGLPAEQYFDALQMKEGQSVQSGRDKGGMALLLVDEDGSVVAADLAVGVGEAVEYVVGKDGVADGGLAIVVLGYVAVNAIRSDLHPVGVVSSEGYHVDPQKFHEALVVRVHEGGHALLLGVELDHGPLDVHEAAVVLHPGEGFHHHAGHDAGHLAEEAGAGVGGDGLPVAVEAVEAPQALVDDDGNDEGGGDLHVAQVLEVDVGRATEAAHGQVGVALSDDLGAGDAGGVERPVLAVDVVNVAEGVAHEQLPGLARNVGGREAQAEEGVLPTLGPGVLAEALVDDLAGIVAGIEAVDHTAVVGRLGHDPAAHEAGHLLDRPALAQLPGDALHEEHDVPIP